MRKPVEICKESARSLAKQRIQQLLDMKPSPYGFIKRIAMAAAIKDEGGVDEIADMLYDMGVRLSLDGNNPDHASWLASGAAIETKE